MRKQTVRAVRLAVAVALVAFLGACDPARDLAIRNESATDVVIVFLPVGQAPREERRLVAGQEFLFGILLNHSTGPFELRRPDGTVMFEGDLTWDELVQMDFLLVITPTGIQRGRAPVASTP